MFKLDFDKEQVLNTLEAIVSKTLSMDMVWDWPCGVAYYGICKAYEVTKKQEYIDALVKWTDEYLSLGLPDFTVNTCAMGHTMLTLYEVTGDEKYFNIVMDKVDYIRNHALRFADHVLQHTVSVKNDFPEQCWADTLFMAAYFLLRVGVKLNDAEIIDDALNQFYWHVNYLQDKKSGLWYHGYDNIEKNHMSGFYWGRANAWAAYTMSNVGKILSKAYLYPKALHVECSLRDQLAGLKNLQGEDGLWHTILDDVDSYGEVSATCGIAAGMLNNKNPLYTKYIQKAFIGVMNNITEDGRVLNVSGGTAVMKDRDGYRNVPKEWIQGWGQGLALTFLATLIEKTENE